MQRLTGRALWPELILGLILGAGQLWAQASGEITGTVTDSSGAPVPDALVQAINVATNVSRNVSTNASGNYVITPLLPGKYNVLVQKSGFRSSQKNEVVIDVETVARVDFALTVGELQQTIEVQATGDNIQSSTAELGSTITQKQVVDLPLNGRNFTQLLTLTPGVSPVNVSQGASGYGSPVTNTAAFVFPSVNGQSNRSNYYMLDGVSDTSPLTGTYATAPIIDSIQEWKTSTHNDAEFGGVTGGFVNVISRSGTNEFHGSAWEYLRNTAFDARNTFQNAAPVLHQNQYGLAVGGPVWIPKVYNGRNRTFFFFGWERFSLKQPANSYSVVPTAANYNGDFSNVKAQLYNPYTTQVQSDGSVTRAIFPGNQIPVSLLNPAAIAYSKALFPTTISTGVGANNYENTVPNTQTQNTWTGRLDQTLGANNQFFLRWTDSDLVGNGTTASASNPRVTEAPTRNVAVNYVRTFGPSTVLQATFGRNHSASSIVSTIPTLGDPQQAAQKLGLADNLAKYPNGYILPTISASGYFGQVGGNYNPSPDLTGDWEGKSNFTKVLGKHTITAGADYNTLTFSQISYFPNETFGPNATAGPGSSGNALASFLLGLPNYAEHRQTNETEDYSGAVWGAFVQDSWKVTSRLTAILGLRYDRAVWPTIYFNGLATGGSWDLNTGTFYTARNWPSCAQTGKAPCIPGGSVDHVVTSPWSPALQKPNTKDFGPRVGLAYRLNDKTALRAGFGLFYDEWAGVTQGAQNADNWPGVAAGWVAGTNLNPANASPNSRFENPDPTAVSGGSLPNPNPYSDVFWYNDPYKKTPYSMQWNFGVEREINSTTTLSASYVGSGSRHIEIGSIYNIPPVPGPNATAPFPYAPVGSYFDRTIGSASYNAFQFQFNRRYSSGLAYTVSYTWSKDLDYGCDGLYAIEGCSIQNPYNIKSDRSVASYDLTNILAISTIYDIPIGKGRRFSTGNSFLNYVLGGWQINNIFTARSGTPFTISSGGDPANTGNGGQERPNLVGNPFVAHPGEAAYFNVNAFAIPAPYTFGNLGRNSLRGPGFWNLDTSLFRQFPFWGESRRIEFRAEAFNVFNAQILGNPSSTLTDPNFGRITGTQSTARVLQLALKVIF